MEGLLAFDALYTTITFNVVGSPEIHNMHLVRNHLMDALIYQLMTLPCLA